MGRDNTGKFAKKRSLLRTDRAKLQGSGVNRAELTLGNLTEEQCDKAIEITWANARAHVRKDKDADGNPTTEPVTRIEDAARLLSVLGLLPHDDA